MANELSLLDTVKESVRQRGETSQDSRRETQRLEDENRSLRRELEDALSDKERLERTIRNLQQTLNPIYRAFQNLFGDIEMAVGEAPNPASPTSGQKRLADPRWAHFKAQFPGAPSQVIDALLIHGTVKQTNLAALLKRDYSTIKGAVQKLVAVGAVERTAEGVSLKRV